MVFEDFFKGNSLIYYANCNTTYRKLLSDAGVHRAGAMVQIAVREYPRKKFFKKRKL